MDPAVDKGLGGDLHGSLDSVPCNSYSPIYNSLLNNTAVMLEQNFDTEICSFLDGCFTNIPAVRGAPSNFVVVLKFNSFSEFVDYEDDERVTVLNFPLLK
jgi:hypothetical protein